MATARLALIALPVVFAAGAAHADILFSDFNESGGATPLYATDINGYVVEGTGPGQTLAVQFQVGGSGTYAGSTIVLGLQDESGTDSYTASLWTNTAFPGPNPAAGAAPDAEIGHWNTISVPSYDGSGNATVTINITGIDLTAGEELWLEVAPGATDTSGLWGFNTTSANGLTENVFADPNAEAYDAADISPLPAFEVEGDRQTPIPEPDSLGLLGSALVGLGALRLRKRKAT